MLELKVFFRKVYQVSKNKNLKILITGGAGMIGSNLVKKLVLKNTKFLLPIIFGEKDGILYTDGKSYSKKKFLQARS